ncbi:terpenoid synthase [Lenzites betulinus]|nr:terpenoid synthase [Lenzites betulinus]
MTSTANVPRYAATDDCGLIVHGSGHPGLGGYPVHISSLRDVRRASKKQLVVANIKQAIHSFLDRAHYHDPKTAPNADLRGAVAAEIMSLNAELSTHFIAGMVDTSCTLTETAFAHLPYEHQLFVSLRTAYVAYVDDLGQRDLEALRLFGQRIATRKSHAEPVLERVALQFEDVYTLFPRLGADSINASTLAWIVGCYIEFTTKGMAVVPGALRYPSYVRNMSGISLCYSFFNFAKGWRVLDDNSYLQIIPELVFCTDHINDILSFYKEWLDGETNNYICSRAVAEGRDELAVLNDVCEEVLDTMRRVAEITSSDTSLADICRGYLMGNIEFHFRAKRYRLAELQIPEQTRP